MNIEEKYLNSNPYFMDGRWITGSAFRGFTLHSVGCAQPDPLVFWRNWNNKNYTNAGINGFIGADVVYITAPCLTQRGRVKRMPHAGSQTGNNCYIGFEMCEPSQIKYSAGARITVLDKSAAQVFCCKTYENAVELFAQLCAFHGKNPLADGTILSHNEMGKRGIGSDHVDPEHLWRQLGMGYTMDGFRRDVYNKMHETGKDEIGMTKEEVTALIDQRIDAKLKGANTTVSSWAKDGLAQAIAAGITDGQRPGGYVTREQAAAMVYRGRRGPELTESAKDKLDSAVAAGITDGSRPCEYATRAEAAIMASRAKK